MPARLQISKSIYYFILSGIVLFFLFIFFSYLVHKDLFTQIDFNMTVRLQDKISRSWDREFSWLSEIGKFEIATIFLIGIFAVFRKILAGFISLVLYAGFHVIELFGKFFVDHPPPPEFMLRTERLFYFPQFHVRSEFSYPSGHSGRAVFISVILITLILNSKKLSKMMKVVLIGGVTIYDISMLVSRIYLGEHWMSDVLGGAFLGASLGFISGGLLFISFKKSVAEPKEIKNKKK